MPTRRDKQEYPHSGLTKRIIAAAMKVHSALGPGYVEKIYETALMRELGEMGIYARQQVRYQVLYNSHPVGEHFLDIVVEDKVYVELKCQQLTGLESAQVLSGLKASSLKVALLINFKTAHLRHGIRRIIRPDNPCAIRPLELPPEAEEE